MIYWVVAASVLGCLVLLYLDGRRSEQEVWRDWEVLLTPKGSAIYHSVERRLGDEMELADYAYAKAFAAKKLGSVDEAVRLLEVGYSVIADVCPDMRRLLAAMSVFSRMVAAIAPVRPLKPADFRLMDLVQLARFNQLVHHFLVSTGERFRLRLFILSHAFRLATRFLLRSTDQIARRTPDVEAQWRQIEAARGDFQTLTQESMESFRVLLMSLAAERRVEG